MGNRCGGRPGPVFFNLDDKQECYAIRVVSKRTFYTEEDGMRQQLVQNGYISGTAATVPVRFFLRS